MRRLGAFMMLISFMGMVGTAGADPNKDSVKGEGLNNPPNGVINGFKLEVKSGPNGEDVKGKVTFTSKATGRKFTGEATCLRVTGSQATIVADITKTKNEPDGFGTNGVIIWVEDNGKKVKGQSPDEIRNSIVPVDDIPASCPAPMDPDRMPLTKGDIKVEDN